MDSMTGFALSDESENCSEASDVDPEWDDSRQAQV